MSDEQKPEQEQPATVPPEPATGDAADNQPATGGPGWGARLRQRVGGLGRGVVVALVAVLLVGALGGFAVGALVSGDRDGRPGHHGGRFDHDGDDRGRPFGDRDDGGGLRPGPQGGLAPAVPDESSPQPDGGSDGSGDTGT